MKDRVDRFVILSTFRHSISQSDGFNSLMSPYDAGEWDKAQKEPDLTMFNGQRCSSALFGRVRLSVLQTQLCIFDAQVSGYLSLSDKTSKYLPPLRESKFGDVSLLDLGTHTPGEPPLQVPENIRNNDQFSEVLPLMAA